MLLRCPNKICGYEWDYRGKRVKYATCPSCLYKVPIRPVNSNTNTSYWKMIMEVNRISSAVRLVSPEDRKNIAKIYENLRKSRENINKVLRIYPRTD
jgi:hypothetical protein